MWRLAALSRRVSSGQVGSILDRGSNPTGARGSTPGHTRMVPGWGALEPDVSEVRKPERQGLRAHHIAFGNVC